MIAPQLMWLGFNQHCREKFQAAFFPELCAAVCLGLGALHDVGLAEQPSPRTDIQGERGKVPRMRAALMRAGPSARLSVAFVQHSRPMRAGSDLLTNFNEPCRVDSFLIDY